MFKSIGLGICCLTLSISGVTRATAINVDCGKYGDDKCVKIENVCDIKDVDFTCDEKQDLKDICANKADLKADYCDLKADEKALECNKNIDGSSEVVKTDCDDIKKDWCDIKTDKCDLKRDICDLHTDLACDSHDDGCHNPCEAVPAPASAGFGGVGVVAMMLISRLRSRRSAAH